MFSGKLLYSLHIIVPYDRIMYQLKYIWLTILWGNTGGKYDDIYT